MTTKKVLSLTGGLLVALGTIIGLHHRAVKPVLTRKLSVKLRASTSPTYTVQTTGPRFYVLQGGGTRVSTANTTGQCDGTANVTYAAALTTAPSGQTTNLHCAWGDYRTSFDDGSFNSFSGTGWGIPGGSVLVVGPGKWRVGPDSMPNTDNKFCFGGQGGCQNPTIPAGTATQHTVIIAACELTNNCSPTNASTIFGGFGIGTPLDLSNAQFVDVIGLEVTRASNCIWFGSPAVPSSCAGQTPTADFDSDGIHTNNQTHDVYMQDLYIHGHTGRGIKGPIGGLVVCERCQLSYNGAAGWDFDDGSSTQNINGIWGFLDSQIDHSGCNQDYPNQNIAVSCYSQSTGGYGDGVGTGTGTGLSAFINNSSFNYNTQDGLDLGHLDSHRSTIVITNSEAIGNNGQGFKWGGAMATVFVNNNLLIANCMRMHFPDILQTDPSYNTNLGDFCRAGDSLSFNIEDFSNETVTNNTIITYSPTAVDTQCWASANDPTQACPNAKLFFANNIVLGYDNPATYPIGGQPGGPGQWAISQGSIPGITRTNNTWWQLRQESCNATEHCVDPQFVNEPTTTGAAFVQTQLDSFNTTLAASSPSIGTGYNAAITTVPSNAPTVIAPFDSGTTPPPVTPPPVTPPPTPTPVALMANAVMVCPEGSTITAASIPSFTAQFGTGTTWEPSFTFTTSLIPFLVSYTTPPVNAFDPAPGVTKQIAAQQQQNTSYTVTCNNSSTPVTVPAIVAAQPIVPTITWKTPASVTLGTILSANQLNATANVPGTFVYSPAVGTILTAGTQTLSTTFTPTDTTHYITAKASVSIVVNTPQATNATCTKPFVITLTPNTSGTFTVSTSGCK